MVLTERCANRDDLSLRAPSITARSEESDLRCWRETGFCTLLSMAKTVPLTEARAKLSELLDELVQRHEHVVITRNGRPTAVLVPADEQEVLEETLEILQDEDILEALRESEEDVKAGRLRTLREVRRDLGLA